MTKEKVNEITINYIVGGIIPMLLLLPFLVNAINSIFYAIFKGNLTWLEASIIVGFCIFIFLTIVFESSVIKLKNYKIKEGCFCIYYYNYFASLYSLFTIFIILLIFNRPIIICIIGAILSSIFFVILQKKLEKAVSNQ